jgi:hypothetical protein
VTARRSAAVLLLTVCACLGGGLSDGGPDGPVVVDDDASVGRDGAVDDDARSAADTIVCGQATCDRRQGLVCCRVAQVCAAQCDGELAYACDGAEDCGGNACCAIVGETPLGSTCSTTNMCDFGSKLCHGSGECTGGQTCCPGTWVAGYCADAC